VSPLSIPEVTTAIQDAYKSDDPVLKASAVYAMGKNCNTDWLPLLLNEMRSTRHELRCEAAMACGELGEESCVPDLIRLTRDPDLDVQLAAIRALGKVGGRQAKERLKQCLCHSSQVIRQAAGESLDELEAIEEPFSFWRLN